MFEQAITSLMSILSLSIGGISVATIIGAFIVLSKKIKKVSLTKDYVEQAFTKAILPANVRIDISQKIMPLVKQALADIEDHMKSFMKEQKEEIEQLKSMLVLTLTILSKFSHTQQLTEDEKMVLSMIVTRPENTMEVQL